MSYCQDLIGMRIISRDNNAGICFLAEDGAALSRAVRLMYKRLLPARSSAQELANASEAITRGQKQMPVL
jgi:hypothetical protein